jgi:hypothetical protein
LFEIPNYDEINTADLAIISGDNPEELRSKSIFTVNCDALPIKASDNKVTRYRLNKSTNKSKSHTLQVAYYILI